VLADQISSRSNTLSVINDHLLDASAPRIAGFAHPTALGKSTQFACGPKNTRSAASMSRPMRNVLILQRVLPSYRVPFFRALHERLSAVGTKLTLLYGKERRGEVPTTTLIDDEWAHQVTNLYMSLRGTTAVVQMVGSRMRQSDLVIVEHANQLLINYWLLGSRSPATRKVALWGHGRNLQSPTTSGLREAIKRTTLARADWWFTYTDGGRRIVEAEGFPTSRITVVNNSVDTARLADAIMSANDGTIAALRAQLGIDSRNVAIYCGGMYPAKRLEFLLAAAVAIRALVPDFHLILVGSGPTQALASQASVQYSWIHYVGPKLGVELATIYRIGKVILMPGLVGLVIVDSFIASLPLFTTKLSAHGPEIEYLKSGVNGIATENDIDAYSMAVVDHLVNEDKLSSLVEGCIESAKLFSIEQMVERFAQGIDDCLSVR